MTLWNMIDVFKSAQREEEEKKDIIKDANVNKAFRQINRAQV